MPNDMTYDFSQDIGGTGYRVTSRVASVSVDYLNAGPISGQSVTADSVSVEDIWPGVDLRQVLSTHAVSSHFTMRRDRELKLGFEVDEAVTSNDTGKGVTSFVDSAGRTAFAIIVGNPRDDTGMSGPPPEVSVIGSGRHWVVGVSMDPRWTTDSSRVYPLSIEVDVALIPVSSVAKAMDRVSMESSSQRESTGTHARDRRRSSRSSSTTTPSIAARGR